MIQKRGCAIFGREGPNLALARTNDPLPRESGHTHLARGRRKRKYTFVFGFCKKVDCIGFSERKSGGMLLFGNKSVVLKRTPRALICSVCGRSAFIFCVFEVHYFLYVWRFDPKWQAISQQKYYCLLSSYCTTVFCRTMSPIFVERVRSEHT